MNDPDFEFFQSRMGAGCDPIAASTELLDFFRARMPTKLTDYWQFAGFAAYADGCFWTVDPREYREVVDAWLIGTRLESERQRMHVVARSAFGTLYLFAEGTGSCGTLDCPSNSVFIGPKQLKPLDARKQDISTRTFFASMTPEDCDFKSDAGKPMFRAARKRLGPLRRNEMYGFVKPLVAGGEWSADNLQVVPAIEHLLALRKLAEPRFPFG